MLLASSAPAKTVYGGPQLQSLKIIIHTHTYARTQLGMGTETRYLICLRAKLWKTGVSISSDVNGSAI